MFSKNLDSVARRRQMQRYLYRQVNKNLIFQSWIKEENLTRWDEHDKEIDFEIDNVSIYTEMFDSILLEEDSNSIFQKKNLNSWKMTNSLSKNSNNLNIDE
jgi:hypothetical protein